MYIFNSFLTEYCKLFGFSSCIGLTVVETFFLAAVGALVAFALVRLIKWFYRGISR
jgi:hypothetical protein